MNDQPFLANMSAFAPLTSIFHTLAPRCLFTKIVIRKLGTNCLFKSENIYNDRTKICRQPINILTYISIKSAQIVIYASASQCCIKFANSSNGAMGGRTTSNLPAKILCQFLSSAYMHYSLFIEFLNLLRSPIPILNRQSSKAHFFAHIEVIFGAYFPRLSPCLQIVNPTSTIDAYFFNLHKNMP